MLPVSDDGKYVFVDGSGLVELDFGEALRKRAEKAEANVAELERERDELRLGMKAWQDKWDHAQTAREKAEAAIADLREKLGAEREMQESVAAECDKHGDESGAQAARCLAAQCKWLLALLSPEGEAKGAQPPRDADPVPANDTDTDADTALFAAFGPFGMGAPNDADPVPETDLADEQIAVLAALANGHVMVFSQDGDNAWLRPDHATKFLNDAQTIGLRRRGFIASKPLDDDDDGGRFGPPSIITDAGRAALAAARSAGITQGGTDG